MVKTCAGTCLVMSMLLSVAFCTAATGKTIYVDDDAIGANNGSNWTDAYIFLQEALADAEFAQKPVEIRVAQGIYRPNEGVLAIPEFDWRTATFQLMNGVMLKGGYAGVVEPDPDARDVATYETVLSGDLNADDVDVVDPCDLLAEPTRSDNSYHVVTGSDVDETAVLDGLTIVDGNADRDEWQGNSSGGGMCNHSGSPTITSCNFSANSAVRDGGGVYNYLYSNPTVTKCTFTGNWASYGGGMCSEHSSPTLDNCNFYANSVEWDGGGMCNSYNQPILTNCTFIANRAYNNGGGMENFVNCSPMVTNCTFSRNSADENGGGMHNEYYTNTTVTNCTFNGNSADENGGGMYNHEESDTILTDCLFVANSCGNGGGGMWNSMSSPTLSHCTFSGNLADFGGGATSMAESRPLFTDCVFSGNSATTSGGMDISWGSDSTLMNCIFTGNEAEWSPGGVSVCCDASSTLVNCILWNNSSAQITGDAVVSYSDVQGGWEGEGNIDVDPLFAEAGYWAHVSDPNIVVEPNDPNAVWADGDYHLKSQAGRWNPVGESWVVDDVTSPCIDAGDPNAPIGDEPAPNGGIINMGAYGGTLQASMSYTEQIVYVQWLGHSTVKIWTKDVVVYVDPERVPQSLHDADVVCVTHTHGDHYSPSDIAKVSNAQTQFIGPPDVVQRYGSGQTIAPGQTINLDGISVTGVPSYNTNKPNHPRSNNWVGFVVELGSKRIYVAGDTDLINEMQALQDIDVAFLPAGGTYTMNAVEAAEATGLIKPGLAIPYHWGQNVGTLSDAQTFVDRARSAALILAINESISSDNWPAYSPLVAHWELDETEGDIAHDSAGDNDGTVQGEPVWRPTAGKVGGAIELDGLDDFIGAGPVLDPADGAFSVFAWVKGGAPGQAVVSQAGAAGEMWLGAEPQSGKLMSALIPPAAGRSVTGPLVPESVITDDAWHHVGFAWDGSIRHLYMDGTEVAADAGPVAPLKSSDAGVNIGVGGSFDLGSFWAGLIDDVRVYRLALNAEEILELAGQ